MDNVKQRWIAELSECMDSINHLNNRTEEDFIGLGETLEKNHDEVKEITEKSNLILSIMAGDEMRNVMNSLQDDVVNIEVLFKRQDEQSRKISNSFLKMKGLMKSSFNEIKEFSKIINKLQVFGISTRIAISRFVQNIMDFKSLSDNINLMSDTVRSKISQIERSIETLFELLNDNLKKLTEIDEHRNELGEEAIIDTRDSIRLMEVNYQEGTKKVDETRGLSTEIEERIGDMVMSAQFHDITRQRLEHVVEAIEDQLKELKNKDEENIPALVKYVLELETVQLEDTSRTFLTEVRSIKENLNELRDLFANMSGLLKTSDQEGKKDDFLDQIGTQIKKIMSDLNLTGKYERELMVSMEHVNKGLTEIRKWMEDLDNIGIEIDMIAQNARIKAFHAGIEGRELGVIAESIQQLSIEVREKIKATSEYLISLLDMTQGNRDDSIGEKPDGNEFDELNSLSENMNSHLSVLDNNNQSFINGLDEIIMIKERLDDRLARQLNSMNVDMEFKKVTDDVSSVLRRVIDEINEYYEHNPPDIEKDKMEEIRKRYTMERERQIHQALETSDSSSGLTIAREEEMDDNIDLF